MRERTSAKTVRDDWAHARGLAVLASAVAACLAMQAGPVDAAPPVTGTVYSGEMVQIDDGQTSRYPMRLLLSGSGGSTDYASLKCGGALTRIGLSGGYVIYRETITYGAFDPVKGDGCVDGIITVMVAGTKAHLGWYGVFDGRGTIAQAELSLK